MPGLISMRAASAGMSSKVFSLLEFSFWSLVELSFWTLLLLSMTWESCRSSSFEGYVDSFRSLGIFTFTPMRVPELSVKICLRGGE